MFISATFAIDIMLLFLYNYSVNNYALMRINNEYFYIKLLRLL